MTLQSRIYSYGMALFSFIYSLSCIPIIYWLTTPTTGEEIMNFAQNVTITLSHLSIVLETVLTKNHQLQFWHLLGRLEDLYQGYSKEVSDAHCKLMRSVRRKFWAVVIMSCLINMITFVFMFFDDNSIREVRSWQYSWTLSMYTSRASQIHHMSQFMAIEVLKMHLKLFNDFVKSLKMKLKCLNKKQVVQELNLVKFRHTFLWELCRNINNCYYWSQMINILVNIFNFTGLCYYLYDQTEDYKFHDLFCKLSSSAKFKRSFC
uniref:Gustatory receptor n=2 Tax=Lutzomyia longipalpis TaxID=7200 RepID=A0A240SXV6_LUTLO